MNEATKVFFFIYFFNERYYWLFENMEDDRTFKSVYEFKLENLKVDSANSEGEVTPTGWKIKLAPKESVVKALHRLDPTSESKYKGSWNNQFINGAEKKSLFA